MWFCQQTHTPLAAALEMEYRDAIYWYNESAALWERMHPKVET